LKVTQEIFQTIRTAMRVHAL